MKRVELDNRGILKNHLDSNSEYEVLIKNNLDADIRVFEFRESHIHLTQIWEVKLTDTLSSLTSGLYERELRDRTLTYEEYHPQYYSVWVKPDLTHAKLNINQIFGMMFELTWKYPHWRFRFANDIEDAIKKIDEWIRYPPKPINCNIPKLVRNTKIPKDLVLSMAAQMDGMPEELAYYCLEQYLLIHERVCWGDLINVPQDQWRDWFNQYYIHSGKLTAKPDDWFERINYQGRSKKGIAFFSNPMKKTTKRKDIV